MNKLSVLALIVAGFALALHFAPIPVDATSTTMPVDEPEALSAAILAQGLGYSWHPIELEGLGNATMIGVGRSTNGKFSGSSASLPEDRNEPLFVFYKIEENWLHYSVVSAKSRMSSKLPILLNNDAGPAGARNSRLSGSPIQIGTEFLSIDTTDGQGESSASLPPDYAAGNAGFAVFVN